MALAENTIDLLNDLLTLHYRSLPMYLTDATPWTHRGDENATETLQDIVADQKDSCRRIAEVITLRGGIVDTGEYPTEFTDMHFLSLDFLLQELVNREAGQVDTIQDIVDRLWNDPPAQAMAKEALGAAKGHLQSLQELVSQMSTSG